jgi:precorrin-6B methylase 2
VISKQSSHPLIIDILNADALRRGSIIVLDLANEETALQLAQKLADATGRSVVVRDAEMVAIQTIPAATRQ